MKPFCCLLLFVSTLSCAQGQRLVSIEAFKKITDPDEREKIAAQAPPQRREELANLDKYLMLTAYDKEKGTQGPKEEAIIKRRGFEYLEVLFRELGAVWQVYLGQTLDSELKAGMSLKERREVEMHIEEELDTYGALQPVVHSLVYHLTTSRRALRLEEKAAELDKEIHGRIVAEPDLPPPFTDRERRELTKKAYQIFKQLKRLPKMTPAQLWKEYDELPGTERLERKVEQEKEITSPAYSE